jgi:hypothetical protein
MKVWITRSASDTVFMGGLREVLLWVDEPFFDHRPRILEAELFDPATSAYVMEIYREEGWNSLTGSIPAKEFLKQDEAIRNRVWEEIRRSMISWECLDPIGYEQGSPLLRKDYEFYCETHWKRFLLEIDLKSETVKLISPMVCYKDNERARGLPLRRPTAISSYFLGADLNRPYHTSDKSLKHLEVRIDRIP